MIIDSFPILCDRDDLKDTKMSMVEEVNGGMLILVDEP